MSYFLTQLGAARFKGSKNGVAFRREVFFHQVSLSGFANAVDALKGDKQSVAQLTSSF
jgi:hypothetical protein